MSRAGLLIVVLAAVILGSCTTSAGGGARGQITISMTEMRFTPNRIDAKVGQTISIRVVNNGAQRHDLAFPALQMPSLQGVETNLAPGESTTITLKFDRQGVHEFICTLPGHAVAGMTGAVYVSQ